MPTPSATSSIPTSTTHAADTACVRQREIQYLGNNLTAYRSSKELQLRGRVFTRADIRLIRQTVKRRFAEGRWRISLAVCEALNWFQENGWPKDRACRAVLNSLHEQGIIRLPPARGKLRVPPSDDLVKKYYGTNTRFHHADICNGDIRAVLAKSDSKEHLWNGLIQEHHYLGHKVQVGRTLKFLLFRGDDVIGAFSLADAAYNVGPRDILLRALRYTRQDVVNNTRFLLIPTASMKNDASRILSLLAACAKQVWPAYYGRPAKMLETFVDTERFRGTSYRAANWVMIGNTRGFKKSGASFSNGQSTKLIFVYPLNRRDRSRILTMAKP